MVIIGIILSVFGLGFFCWLLFTLAVYALPFFAGTERRPRRLSQRLGRDRRAHCRRARWRRDACDRTDCIRYRPHAADPRPDRARSMPCRRASRAITRTLGFADIGVPSEVWREAFAIVGAVLVGATAFARMALFVPPPTGQGSVEGPAHSPLACGARPRR